MGDAASTRVLGAVGTEICYGFITYIKTTTEYATLLPEFLNHVLIVFLPHFRGVGAKGPKIEGTGNRFRVVYRRIF